MTSWIIPCNEKYYNHRDAFVNLEYIDWRQNVNMEIGDEVYIYVGQSVGAILYKCAVVDVDMKNESNNDEVYVMHDQLLPVERYMRLKLIKTFAEDELPRRLLFENGLKTVQGATRATGQLLRMLEKK